jgi:hypothetical protein
MERSEYLIDTNVVIDFLGNKLPLSSQVFMNGVIDATPNFSIITKIELLGFNMAENHFQILSDFIDEALVFAIDDKVVTACIEIRKKHKIKLPDAIIAATALAHNMVLITRNTSDFKRIDGLILVDSHDL